MNPSLIFLSSQQPTQMQSSDHHLPSHRPPAMTSHCLSAFPQAHTYESIKIEDENHSVRISFFLQRYASADFLQSVAQSSP